MPVTIGLSALFGLSSPGLGRVALDEARNLRRDYAFPPRSYTTRYLPQKD